VGLVVTVCMVILLYEARVANSLLGNHRFMVWSLDCSTEFMARHIGHALRTPHIEEAFALIKLIIFSSTQQIS